MHIVTYLCNLTVMSSVVDGYFVKGKGVVKYFILIYFHCIADMCAVCPTNCVELSFILKKPCISNRIIFSDTAPYFPTEIPVTKNGWLN